MCRTCGSHGMVHAPRRAAADAMARARRTSTPTAIESCPGVLKVVRDGNFLAVVAQREYQAVMRDARAGARRQMGREPSLPDRHALPHAEAPRAGHRRSPSAAAAAAPGCGQRWPRSIRGLPDARLDRAVLRGGALRRRCATVWTHTPGRLSRCATRSPSSVARRPTRCTASTSKAPAATATTAPTTPPPTRRCSRAHSRRPVRVQWMREQEHAWEPFGPPMVTDAEGRARRQRPIADWNLRGLEQHPFDAAGQRRRSDRGAVARDAVRADAAEAAAAARRRRRPQRDPALHARRTRTCPPLHARHAAAGLGAALARRLHERLLDRELHGRTRARCRRRSGRVPAEASGRSARPRRHHSRGASVRLDGWKPARAAAAALRSRATRILPPMRRRARGRGRSRHRRVRVVRAVAAVDSGEAVNPDGISNQIEGGILQSSSWTLFEAVTFDRTRITSRDWSGYPILRFRRCPSSVDVHVIDRPGQPSSAPARRRRDRRGGDRQRASPTRPACACATCRSRPTGFALQCSSDGPQARDGSLVRVRKEELLAIDLVARRSSPAPPARSPSPRRPAPAAVLTRGSFAGSTTITPYWLNRRLSPSTRISRSPRFLNAEPGAAVGRDVRVARRRDVERGPHAAAALAVAGGRFALARSMPAFFHQRSSAASVPLLSPRETNGACAAATC